MSDKIFIGNLPFSAGEEEVKKLVENYSEVLSVRLVRDPRSGESRGFGFVEVAEIMKVIDGLDAKEYKDRSLVVKPALERGNW